MMHKILRSNLGEIRIPGTKRRNFPLTTSKEISWNEQTAKQEWINEQDKRDAKELKELKEQKKRN